MRDTVDDAARRTGHTIRDIEFSRVDGYRPLSADLHLPAGPPSAVDGNDTTPVVVFVHGGGWFRGSRRMFCPGFDDDATFGAITARGWAVLSVDYRLSSEAVFPAPLQDVEGALDWLRDVGADEFGLDVDRVVLWGESAGAHLAALAALRNPDRVRAVIDWYGPTDLALLLEGADASDAPTREQALLGGPGAFTTDDVRAASPRFAVTPDAPPFHVAHGLADDLVPPVHSEALVTGLRDVGATAELQLVPDAGHLWRGLDDLSVVMRPALDFLDHHVAGSR